MASAFELLEAYVTISERGAAQTINRIRQVEAAAIAASQRNIVIGISTSLDNALAQLNRVTNVLNQIAIDARSLSFSQTNNTLTQTVSLTQQVVNNTFNMAQNTQKARQQVSGLNKALSLVAGAAAGYLSLQTAINAVSASFTESFGRERSFITFRQLIGNADEAKKLLEELENLARRTPFAFPELRQTAQRLLALGSSTENIADEILLIANVSAGTGASLEQISRVYTQVRSKQQLYAEELQQFGDAGVPILQELAKNLNTNEQGVRKLAEQGKIGFDEVERAFRTLTTEGGKFANLVTEIGNTTPALLTRLRDEAVGLGADLAGMKADNLNESLANAAETLRAIRDLSSGFDDDVQKAQETSRAYAAAYSAAEFLYTAFFDPIGRFNATATPVRETIESQRDLKDAYDQTYRSIVKLDEAALAALEKQQRVAAAAQTRWSGLKTTVEEATKALQSDRRLADSIRESVLTPYEQLEQKLEDIQRLQNRGLITPEIRTRAIKAANEEYRRLAETFDDLSDSWQKVLDDFNSDPNVAAAERIRESLLTPYEELEQKIREIAEVHQSGFLDEDTAYLAVQNAVEEYDKLLRRQEKLARSIQRSSFTVGSSEAFRVVLENTSNEQEDRRARMEQRTLQSQANRLLREILSELAQLNNAPPELNQNTFDTTEIF